MFTVKEIKAKSIIGHTAVPSADFVINPYTGCQFGCMYCFASFMGRFVSESNANWGNYVYVKTNAVELMQKDIQRLLKKDTPPRIAISTVTDPYQGIEKKYRLTRGILQTFANYNYQGRVSILTKSPMVLKDVDVLQKIKHAEVGLSITTSNDQLSRLLEVQAPLASTRIKTLEKLNDVGINTYVFMGPFLPHLKYKPELLEELFKSVANTGTKNVKIEYLNLPKHVKGRFNQLLKAEPKEVQELYAHSQTKQYRDEMSPIIKELLNKYNLNLKFGEIVTHIEQQNLVEK